MFSPLDEILAEYAAGRPIIIVDDEDRENEGDLACAAEHVTPELIAFMAREGRGLICLAMAGGEIDRLGLPPMARRNGSPFGTNFTVSIEAAQGVTTGISAADRAHTIRVATDPASGPRDLIQPGHIFPLRAAPGGVLERTGQTEASVDLAILAGLRPAGVICEIMNDDGTMARRDDLAAFAQRHGLKLVTVAQIAEYRRSMPQVRREGQAQLPTERALFSAISYTSLNDGSELIAMVLGDVADGAPVLARLHSECLTGDVFGSQRCDCRAQLEHALDMVAALGRGVVLYLRQEGRGIGIHNKLRAYALQEQGLDTVEANEQLGFPADLRDYGAAAGVLRDLGVGHVRLLTNNPRKLQALAQHGLTVEHVPLALPPTPHNARYLATKQQKLGHLLEESYAHL